MELFVALILIFLGGTASYGISQLWVGARGRFSDRTADHGPQMWAAMHRGPLTLGALLAAAAAVTMTLLAADGREREHDRTLSRSHAGPGPREREGLRRLIADGS